MKSLTDDELRQIVTEARKHANTSFMPRKHFWDYYRQMAYQEMDRREKETKDAAMLPSASKAERQMP